MNCAWTRYGLTAVSLGLLLGAACASDPSNPVVPNPGAGNAARPVGGGTGGGILPGTGGAPGVAGPRGGSSAGGSTSVVAPPPGAGAGAQPPSGGAGVPPVGEATPVGGPDWISYGNGAKNWFNATGETKITVDNVKSLAMKWKAQSDWISGTPVVVGDTVYVMTASGLKTYDANSGMAGWAAANVRGQTSPAYDPETQTIFASAGGLMAGPGVMFAFDAKTGMMKWTKPATAQPGSTGWASPAVIGNYVATGLCAFDAGSTFKGGVAAFDKVTGDQVLDYQLGKQPGSGVWSGVSGDEAMGIIYGGSGNNYSTADEHSDSLFAIDIAKKAQVWNFQATMGDNFNLTGAASKPDYDFGTHPILVDVNGKHLIAAGQKSGTFWVRDRDTGDKVWDVAVTPAAGGQQATGGILNNGAFDGERFITASNKGSSPGVVVALKADTGEMVWSKPLKGLVWAPITVANGVCFVPDNTTLEMYNCATGDLLNSITAPKTVGSGVAISNGRIFFGSGWNYMFSMAGTATQGPPYELYSYAIP